MENKKSSELTTENVNTDNMSGYMKLMILLMKKKFPKLAKEIEMEMKMEDEKDEVNKFVSRW